VEGGDYLLSSAEWQVSSLSGTAPSLTLRNQDCRIADKNDVANPLGIGTPGVAGLGKSTWTCTLGIVAPTTVPSDTVYTLVLVGTNVKGQSTTTSRTVRLLASTPSTDPAVGGSSSNMEVSVAGGLVGRPGQTLTLESVTRWIAPPAGSTGDPAVTYSWSLASSAQTVATLLKTSGSQVQLFLTPTQAVPAFVPVTVTATGSGGSASETVTVLVDPFEPLGPSVAPVVQTTFQGCPVTITAHDIDVSDPKLFYGWQIVEGSQVPLAGANTLKVGFFAPTTTEVLRVRFAASYYPITTSYANLTTNFDKAVYWVDALVKVDATGPCPAVP
jgi:hypothetical protein